MLEEKDSHEGPLRFLAMFQHPVQPPRAVKPTERSFHLPPLAALAPVMASFRGATPWKSDMVLAIRSKGNKAPLAQRPAVRFTVVAFVQAQAVGFALPLPDADAIKGLPQLEEGITVGFTQGTVEGRTMGINAQLPCQPFTLVFSRVPDFLVRPFLDFTTLAS
jgi:hypothetical protein